MSKHLWGELASTAIFIKKRIPHIALGSDTAYHQMFGKYADLSFLRVIGRAFVHEEGHREKLDQRALGRCLINSGILSSRNVTFLIDSIKAKKDNELS